MKKQQNDAADIKPDLKHDSMEYAASTDGEDILNTDELLDEEEDLTAEELEIIEGGDEMEQAVALNSVENDRLADEDNFLDSEPGDELEEYEEEDIEGEQENERNR